MPTALPVNDQPALTRHSAAELAAMIANGEISSVEAVEAHIQRIEQVNPKLNALVVKRYEAARSEARQADERRARGEKLPPLHGVPVTIKECLDLEGTPSTFGLSSLSNSRAQQDEIHVARLRQAGAIILGKTNVAQLLIYIESDNPVYGRTNNPWNIDRSPGGSSGGEGAIIAAGGSALGLGTDIGGSVRIPAAFCGIASFKPTAGRTPDPGRYSLPIGQRAIVSQVGVLARRVSDVALGLEIINGGRNPSVEPPMPLGDFKAVDISQLRVACYTDDGVFPVAPAVRRAVREAADTLRSCGAQVTEWTPPDIAQAIRIFYSLLTADGGRGFVQALGSDKRDSRAALLTFMAGRSRLSLSFISKGLQLLGQRGLASGLDGFGHNDTFHYWQMVEAQMNYRQRFLASLDQADGGPFDLVLSPAFALPAVTHGASGDLGVAGSYTILYNLLGFPSGIVPFTRVRQDEQIGRAPSRDRMENTAYQVETSSAGLPIGVQLAARPWREHVALAAMQAIEQAARTRSDFPMTPVQS